MWVLLFQIRPKDVFIVMLATEFQCDGKESKKLRSSSFAESCEITSSGLAHSLRHSSYPSCNCLCRNNTCLVMGRLRIINCESKKE